MADLILGKVVHRSIGQRPAAKPAPRDAENDAETVTDPRETGELVRFRRHRVARMCDGIAGEQPPPSLRALITHLASRCERRRGLA